MAPNHTWSSDQVGTWNLSEPKNSGPNDSSSETMMIAGRPKVRMLTELEQQYLGNMEHVVFQRSFKELNVPDSRWPMANKEIKNLRDPEQGPQLRTWLPRPKVSLGKHHVSPREKYVWDKRPEQVWFTKRTTGVRAMQFKRRNVRLWTGSGVLRPRRRNPQKRLEREFDDRETEVPLTSRPTQRRRWRSQLWRLARRVPLPPNWTFDLWVGVFAIFLVALMFARHEGLHDAVESLLATVKHMGVSDYLWKLLGPSPTSPKPRGGGGYRT